MWRLVVRVTLKQSQQQVHGRFTHLLSTLVHSRQV
jgi:hypothetical protein